MEFFRQGLVTSQPDIHDGSLDPYHVELLANLQVRANLVVPIRQNEQLWGFLIAHHCAAPRQWQAEEISLRRGLTTQLEIALKQAELYRQVQTELFQRKRIEAELRSSHEQLQMALDGSGGGLWHWHITTNESYLSPSWLQLLDYEVDELPHHYSSWEQLLHPDEKAGVLKRLEAHLQDDAIPFQVECRMRSKFGEWKWIANYGQVIRRDEQGNPLEMAGIQFDISDRKRAQADLEASEERFRASVESMLDCFAIYRAVRNDQGQILDFQAEYINDAACITGQISRQEHLSKGLCELLPIHRSNGLFEAYCRVVETGEALFKENTIFQEQFGQQRLTKAFDIRVAKYGDGYIATWRDITDRKLIERERELLLERERIAREQAEQANRIKDDFLAVLSHELRSPLNPILGWVKLLQTQNLNSTRATTALDTIERNVKLQTQLIDDLLDVSRILRGKLKLETSPIDPVSIIESALDTVRPAATAKNIRLNPVLPSIGVVLGDATRLQQIVWNLLSNAIKFTPAHGQVDIRLEPVDQQAQIIVRDTGKGINPGFLPYLFESFRQEDASTTRSHGGLGLGLAIVRYLVEAHGGTIWAHSEGEEQGATFTVQLPLLEAAPAPVTAPPEQADNPDLSGLRILTVDDEADARELLTAFLSAYGAEVLAMASASEVMGHFESFQPDIFVFDIGMPETSGYTLLQNIRELMPATVNPIPAIAVTAYAREEDRRQALDNGFQAHIAKPIDFAALAATILQLTRP